MGLQICSMMRSMDDIKKKEEEELFANQSILVLRREGKTVTINSIPSFYLAANVRVKLHFGNACYACTVCNDTLLN